MIRIGFSRRDRNVLSKLIRRMTGAEASHCWLLIDDGTFGLPLVMEASEFGYRMVPFEGYEKANHIVTVIDPAWPLEAAIKESAKWLGERYDFAGLFGMAFVLAARWMKRKLKNPLHSAHAVFCSEAVLRVLQAASYPGALSLDAEDATPSDVLALLRQEK